MTDLTCSGCGDRAQPCWDGWAQRDPNLCSQCVRFRQAEALMQEADRLFTKGTKEHEESKTCVQRAERAIVAHRQLNHSAQEALRKSREINGQAAAIFAELRAELIASGDIEEGDDDGG